ncbi:GFA family protein [Pseudomonas sp. MWU13-2100]|uniref:GFA family protein n=1 Tax=Pseudomonas sp. MWU13-2100 TaxID=2935075 RepID=UPI00200F0803|nr:GFA family protein [Pseudomonas sp. MWU13-2100]
MKGSCACGTVAYEIDAIDMPIGHCHCRTCRKTHAAAFTTTAGVKREHFRWLKGQERLAAYEASPGKLRHFCSQCGSHLMAERPHLPIVIVRVATLDDDPGVIAEEHIWVSHDVPWLAYEGMAEYPEWQSTR